MPSDVDGRSSALLTQFFFWSLATSKCKRGGIASFALGCVAALAYIDVLASKTNI